MRHGGIWYTWKRTHDSALGASKFGTKDFALFRSDGLDGRPLASLITKDNAMYASFWQKMDKDLEAIALIAILTTVAKVKKVFAPPVTAVMGGVFGSG